MTFRTIGWMAAMLTLSGCSIIVDPELPSGTQTKVFGQTCGANEECQTGLCRDLRCSQTCDASDPCPAASGATCGGDGVCAFAASGSAAFGDACTAPAECGSGLCVGGRCSQACSASAPCPGVATECASEQCTFLPTGEGMLGARCAAGSDCVTGRCNVGRCTQPCSDTNACPGSNTTCDSGAGLCSFTTAPPLEGDLRAGYLYVGPVGDHGWTLTHDRGRIFAQDQIANSTSEFVPAVAAADAPRVIEDLIANGNNVILGTSFDFLVPILSAAPNNPDVNFLICSGFQTGPNLGSYFGRMYQVMYMMGVLAGRVTQNNRIGIVGPVVIPETVRHLNAFTLGAQSVNPNVEVYIEWVEAWFNPPVEQSTTETLLRDADVDIIFGFTDTTIPIEVASTATTASGDPVFVIGYDNRDSCDYRPEITPRCLTSAYWNWGPMVSGIFQDMIDGNWDPETPVWQQMRSTPEQSSAYFSELNTQLVNTEIRLEVESLISPLTEDSEAARQLPFAPPIRDVAGNERLSMGSTFTDDDLLEMCWLVEGIFHADGSPGTVPANCVGVR